jgi:hypothetical protein
MQEGSLAIEYRIIENIVYMLNNNTTNEINNMDNYVEH